MPRKLCHIANGAIHVVVSACQHRLISCVAAQLRKLTGASNPGSSNNSARHANVPLAPRSPSHSQSSPTEDATRTPSQSDTIKVEPRERSSVSPHGTLASASGVVEGDARVSRLTRDQRPSNSSRRSQPPHSPQIFQGSNEGMRGVITPSLPSDSEDDSGVESESESENSGAESDSESGESDGTLSSVSQPSQETESH